MRRIQRKTVKVLKPPSPYRIQVLKDNYDKVPIILSVLFVAGIVVGSILLLSLFVRIGYYPDLDAASSINLLAFLGFLSVSLTILLAILVFAPAFTWYKLGTRKDSKPSILILDTFTLPLAFVFFWFFGVMLSAALHYQTGREPTEQSLALALFAILLVFAAIIVLWFVLQSFLPSSRRELKSKKADGLWNFTKYFGSYFGKLFLSSGGFGFIPVLYILYGTQENFRPENWFGFFGILTLVALFQWSTLVLLNDFGGVGKAKFSWEKWRGWILSSASLLLFILLTVTPSNINALYRLGLGSTGGIAYEVYVNSEGRELLQNIRLYHTEICDPLKKACELCVLSRFGTELYIKHPNRNEGITGFSLPKNYVDSLARVRPQVTSASQGSSEPALCEEEQAEQ